MTRSKTLGELRKSGYKPRSIKDELRENLIAKLKNKEAIFSGIWGYEETVIPDLERAILAGHEGELPQISQPDRRTSGSQDETDLRTPLRAWCCHWLNLNKTKMYHSLSQRYCYSSVHSLIDCG